MVERVFRLTLAHGHSIRLILDGRARLRRALIKPDDFQQSKRLVPGSFRSTNTRAVIPCRLANQHKPQGEIRARQSLALPSGAAQHMNESLKPIGRWKKIFLGLFEAAIDDCAKLAGE